MKNFMGFDGFVWWMGVVEDNNDPEQMGRVRVRCLGLHTEDKEALPTEDLPWAMVMMPTTGASTSQVGSSPSGLLNGSWVMGFFRDATACQEPVVIGTFHGRPAERPNTSYGFADPSGVNPVEIDEPDTSRLARGDRRSAVYQTRNSGVVGGHASDVNAEEDPTGREKTAIANKPLPWGEGTWTATPPPFNPRYPYNRVMQTESGHALEFDDTPDNERILIFHRKDTFVEFHPDGKLQIHVYDKGEILVDEDLNIEAKGNVNIFTQGNTTIYSKNNIDMQSEEDVRIRCKNFTVEAETNIKGVAGELIDLDSKLVDIDGSKRIDLN